MEMLTRILCLLTNSKDREPTHLWKESKKGGGWTVSHRAVIIRGRRQKTQLGKHQLLARADSRAQELLTRSEHANVNMFSGERHGELLY